MSKPKPLNRETAKFLIKKAYRAGKIMQKLRILKHAKLSEDVREYRHYIVVHLGVIDWVEELIGDLLKDPESLKRVYPHAYARLSKVDPKTLDALKDGYRAAITLRKHIDFDFDAQEGSRYIIDLIDRREGKKE